MKTSRTKIRILLAGSCVALLLSCGKAKVYSATVEDQEILQAAREYGKGHGGLLQPGSTEKPTEDSDLYHAHIRALLAAEDFAQLEREAELNRTEKRRVLGGSWKVNSFFEGLGYPAVPDKRKEEDFDVYETLVKKWVAAYPQSSAAQLTLAEVYYARAWFLRGSGMGNTVSSSQWRGFERYVNETEATLLQTAKLKQRDPRWFEMAIELATIHGWERAESDELLRLATTFEPSYYHYYRDYARYLNVNWNGQPGDIRAFAEVTAKKLAEPDASMNYFFIMSANACYCGDNVEELVQADYLRLREGYRNIVSLYGTTNLNANRFAFMTAMFHDRNDAELAFKAIERPDMSIWVKQENYDYFKYPPTAKN